MYDHRRLNPLADGRGVTVAVVDSGVDGRHPQLRGAVAAGPDQLDGGGSVLDCVGHGTGVAGIIAARPVSGSPFRGLAPGATILALRVSELVELEDGTTTGRRGTPQGIANAIRDAVTGGAGVINLSLVTYADHPEIRDAIRLAVSKNVVVVAAAGNRFENGNRLPYPAAYEGVLGVGAITADGQRAPNSQTGPHVDLVAPGAQLVTTATPQGLTTVDGTSFAVPYVSAAAALLRQYRPDLSAAEIATRLKATADGGGTGFGAGVLNPYRALTEETAPSTRAAGPTLGPVHQDPGAAARSAAESQTLLAVAWALAAAVLVAVFGFIVTRGHRRRWQPGFKPLPPPRPVNLDPHAPAFGDPLAARRRKHR